MRFPGFEGEWQAKRLGDLLDFKNGINASKEQYGRGIKFVNVSDILNNSFLTYENIVGFVDVDNVTLSKYSVEYGDLLFQRSSETREEVGTANVYLDKEKAATFGGFVIRGKRISNYDPFFLNNLLKSDAARNSITSRSGGSTRYNVGQDILSSVELCFPSIPEQEKIGHLLFIIDSRIQTQSKIIQRLETQMLGFQEKIFKQKIKFKDNNGEEFPIWSYKNGSDLFESISNKKHNSDLPILAITQNQGAIPRDLIDYQIAVTERSVESYKVVEVGDFIISLRSFQGGIEHSDYKGICSPAYIVLRNKIEIVSSFYKYYFKTPDYISLLNKKLEGIRDGKMISYNYFSEIPVPFPIFEEQRRIASFLSKIDRKIQTGKAILGQLEKQKKYLLQQMFV